MPISTANLDLSALSDFQVVAAYGGFGEASRATGRAKATLSRRVAELEAAIGIRLFERGDRGLRLTEVGEELYARAAGPLSDLAQIIEMLPRPDGQPHGMLRISAPIVFAHTHLARIAAHFAGRHPSIQLEIVAEDRFAELVDERVDIAIRANPAADDRLIGRRLIRTDRVAVASPELLRPEGDDSAPLLYRIPEPPPSSWSLRNGDERRLCKLRPAMGFSSLLIMRDAAVRGAGVALLPRTLIGSDLDGRRLVSWGVLDGVATEIWVLHTSRRFVSAKVRAFLDLLDVEFPSG